MDIVTGCVIKMKPVVSRCIQFDVSPTFVWFEFGIVVFPLNKNWSIVLQTRLSCCFFPCVFLFGDNENMCLFSVWSRHPDQHSIIC